MADEGAAILPGRLGSPDMELRDDPRADPRMVAAMAPYGIGQLAPPPPVDSTTPRDALFEYIAAVEEQMEGMFAALFGSLAPVEGVVSTTEVIRGVDGNDITLYVHRPVGGSGPRPAILHLHGGAMTILEATAPVYIRWRDELAAAGLVVVGVEFRNAAGKLGAHPFPAGLNDCASGLQWLTNHKAELGISTVVVSGESGGGNLTLATALKAKRDGRLDQIDGVYAMCPSISNAYIPPRADLTSLFENEGYFLRMDMLGPPGHVYNPAGDHATDPLAWPLHATGDDLSGLPPHVISVNQLDPLRDEGLAFARLLLDAGVSVVSRTVNGTSHAGDCFFRAALPDVYLATIRDIAGFANSL